MVSCAGTRIFAVVLVRHKYGRKGTRWMERGRVGTLGAAGVVVEVIACKLRVAVLFIYIKGSKG